MYFQYGGYQHAPGEAQITFATNTILDSQGRPERLRKTISLSGVIVAAGQAAIRTAVEALETAYSRHGFDAGLYHDDGTPSPHFLSNNQSLTGVRVVSLEFPLGDGTEYATGRSYAITLQADYQPPRTATTSIGGNPSTTSFQETLQFMGTGGPRRVLRETLRGFPSTQIAAQRTICRAMQTGSASGLLGVPQAPAPLWPALEVSEKRELNIIGPQREGASLLNWGVAWSYHFESPRPLFGSPHRR